MNKIGIDVYTKNKNNIISRLKNLKSTLNVCDGGVYHADFKYSQIHLETTKTIEQLDEWLYNTKGIDYIGTFELK